MPTPRPRRRTAAAVAAVALFGLLGLSASVTPGQPDKKPKADKKNVADDVQIAYPPYEYTSEPYPYDLKVNYTTNSDGMEVAIEYNGKSVDPQDAPKTGGTLTFKLDYNGDTTCETITAKLRRKSTLEVTKTDTRSCITFIGDVGMGGTAVKKGLDEKNPADKKGTAKWAEPFPFDLPPGEKIEKYGLAKKAANKNDPIAAGYHHGHFPPMGSPADWASARMWLMGKFAGQKPLRMYYDRPISVFPQLRNGKWYPRWSTLLLEPLEAESLTKGGEVPETVVFVALFDWKGKVIHIMHYPH